MKQVKLSKESYSNLLQAERNLSAQLPTLDKLEECGVDCQAMRQLTQDKLEQIGNIKKHFAPNSGNMSQE